MNKSKVTKELIMDTSCSNCSWNGRLNNCDIDESAYRDAIYYRCPNCGTTILKDTKEELTPCPTT